MRKLGFTIDSLEEGYGDNSKWKWSFVELEGRFAAVAKNLLNLKTFVAGMDPRSEGYSARIAHLALAKDLLQQAADRYREKYELSTMRIDDIKTGINFLAAVRRLHIVLGESDQADVVKKKAEIWRTKMENDLKKAEEKPEALSAAGCGAARYVPFVPHSAAPGRAANLAGAAPRWSFPRASRCSPRSTPASRAGRTR